MKKNGFAVVLVLVAVLAILGVGYYYFNLRRVRLNLEEKNLQVELDLKNTANKVISLLANKKFPGLSDLVASSRGVFFSPYVYVHPETDIVMKSAGLKDFMSDQKVYTWGFYDGSGFAIKLSPKLWSTVYVAQTPDMKI